MKKEEKKTVVIIEGIVKMAKYGTSKFDDNNKYRIWLGECDIPYEDIWAFDEVGKKLTPSWFAEKNGEINLSSLYDIPVKNIDGNRIDFDTWIASKTAYGSKVKVSIIQKEGAVYPKAVMIIAEGEPVEEADPFVDFN